MRDLVLGLDLGTTSFKAGAFDDAGDRPWSFAAPVTTHRGPGGRAEQDPAEWLALLQAALGDLRAAGLAGRVAGLGLTSQVNTHVLLDGAGRALAPAILWQDTRAAADAARLDAAIQDHERLAWWGAPMGVDASHALARMAWAARERPEAWAACRALCLPKDLLALSLTGQLATDPLSNIGLTGADGLYPPALLARVPGAAERLPPLRPMTALVGEAALAPGLPPVPVAVGVMDAWASFLGVGMRGDGDAAWLSGTSEVLGIASRTGPGAPGILVFPEAGGLRVHAGPTQSGGDALAWACALLGLGPEEMEAEVAAAGPAPRTPLFLPHLAGERAPLWDPTARGAFLGLEAGMGRAALARSVYEGVALSARLALEAVEASAGRRAEVLLCGGGGFRSDLWAQIRADAVGRPLHRLRVPDAGVVGAAALGAVAARLRPDLAAALASLAAHDRVFEPRPEGARRMDDLFALYRPAWDALRDTSRALALRP
jgi:xylulokinase